MRSQFSRIWYFFGVAFMIWIYLILRAWYVPLVHDEVATFFHYIHKEKFLPFQAHWDANNHILNSGLSVFFYKLFGHHPLVLRLSNLLFFPLYFSYVYMIGTLIRSNILTFIFWACMLFPHNLIEFFALTRGYGMSMALLMAAIYHAFVFIKSNKTNQLVFSLSYIFFALTANLTLTSTALLMIGWFVLIVIIRGKSNFFKNISVVMVLGSVCIGLASIISFEMKKRGLLYYGEGDSFYSVTIKSISLLISGTKSFISEGILMYVFILLVIFTFIFIFQTKWKEWFFSIPLLASLLMLGNIIAIFSMHYLLGVNFPEDRTGMYLYFLLFIGFIFMVDELMGNTGRRIFLMLVLPFALTPIHFGFSMNLSYSALWKQEHYPYRFYETIKNENPGIIHEVGIGAYGIQRLVWAYYNYCDGGNLNLLQTADFPRYAYDYLIYSDDMVPASHRDYDVVDVDPFSGLHLLRKKIRPYRKLIYERSINYTGGINQEFYELYSGIPDSLKGKSIAVHIKLKLRSDQKPFNAHVISSILDKTSNTLYYESLQFDWLKDKWDENVLFNHTMFIYEIPQEANNVVVYIWNLEKVLYTIYEGEVKVYELIQPD